MGTGMSPGIIDCQQRPVQVGEVEVRIEATIVLIGPTSATNEQGLTQPFLLMNRMLTLALNVSISGSTELVPGSRRRSCERPCVIIEVPNGMRLGVIGDGVIFR